MIPGEIRTQPGEIELNAGRRTLTLKVANTGDRPIQVGSHYHFYETNSALEFDREQARGYRLNIAAGTAVRFEPGQSRTVRLTPYMGSRESYGFQAKVSGKLGPAAKVGPSNEGPARISRSAYVHMFGPTTGDKVRLADTDLFVEVEKDHARMNTRAQKKERLGAGLGSDGAQTFESEEVDEPLAQRGVVVDDQDVGT